MAGAQGLQEREAELDIDYQRRSWTFERVGWGVMGVILAAALLGLCGEGPLAKARTGDTGGLVQLQYDRFTRHGGQTVLEIEVAPGAAANRAVRVWLSRSYLESVQVEQVTPEPDEMEAGQDRLTYVFRLAGSDERAVIAFRMRPERYGPLTGRMGLADGPELRFRQLVYP